MLLLPAECPRVDEQCGGERSDDEHGERGPERPVAGLEELLRDEGFDVERQVVVREGRVDDPTAAMLVELAGRIRRLQDSGLPEAPSPRVLDATARLIARGIPPREACEAALVGPLSDDPDLRAAIGDLLSLTL